MQAEEDAHFRALARAYTIKNPRGPPAHREQAQEGQRGPIGPAHGPRVAISPLWFFFAYSNRPVRWLRPNWPKLTRIRVVCDPREPPKGGFGLVCELSKSPCPLLVKFYQHEGRLVQRAHLRGCQWPTAAGRRANSRRFTRRGSKFPDDPPCDWSRYHHSPQRPFPDRALTSLSSPFRRSPVLKSRNPPSAYCRRQFISCAALNDFGLEVFFQQLLEPGKLSVPKIVILDVHSG